MEVESEKKQREQLSIDLANILLTYPAHADKV